MLARLSGKSRYAYKAAEAAARAAEREADEKLRKEYLRLETSWFILAASYEFAERISSFIEWSAQRVPDPDRYPD